MVTSIRVAGIWVVEGAILLESLADRAVWGIPGGRLKEGVVREYREETGLAMRCTSLAIVEEGFWNNGGMPVREYGFYFRVAYRHAGSRPQAAGAEPGGATPVRMVRPGRPP